MTIYIICLRLLNHSSIHVARQCQACHIDERRKLLLSTITGLQLSIKYGSFSKKFFFISKQNLWCDHPLESSHRDDSNGGHAIGFGQEMN